MPDIVRRRARYVVVGPKLLERSAMMDIKLATIMASIVPGNVAGKYVADGGLGGNMPIPTRGNRVAPVILDCVGYEHIALHGPNSIAVHPNARPIPPQCIVKDEVIRGCLLHKDALLCTILADVVVCRRR